MKPIAILLAALFAFAQPVLAVEKGEDGLHKPSWLHVTFKDIREDLAEANAQGKRLVIIYEQRGCIYCTKMHTEVFPVPEIDALLHEKFYVVQMNLFGDEEVTDFDGTVLTEKDMANRWGVFFTPTILFMPEETPEAGNAARAAIAVMAGAYSKGMTKDLLDWVLLKGYDTDEHFQKYHARMINERKALSE